MSTRTNWDPNFVIHVPEHLELDEVALHNAILERDEFHPLEYRREHPVLNFHEETDNANL